MELFIKLSSKTELQECLDLDLKKDSCGGALEEAPFEAKQDGTLTGFDQPNKKGRFRVDLWEGWARP